MRFKYEILTSLYDFLNLALVRDLFKKLSTIKIMNLVIRGAKLQKPTIDCVNTTPIPVNTTLLFINSYLQTIVLSVTLK